MSYFQFVQALHQGLSWSHGSKEIELQERRACFILRYYLWSGKSVCIAKLKQISPFSWNGREYRD